MKPQRLRLARLPYQIKQIKAFKTRTMVKDSMEPWSSLEEGCEEQQKAIEQTGGEWPIQESTQAPGLSKQSWQL